MRDPVAPFRERGAPLVAAPVGFTEHPSVQTSARERPGLSARLLTSLQQVKEVVAVGASNGEALVVQPDRFEVPDVLAAVRGLLDVALERCPPESAAALEICAAWEGLDAVSASSLVVPTLPSALGPLVVLATARRLVRGAILRVEPLSAALLLAEALRHLDTAAQILAAEESGEAQPWA